MSFLSLQSFGQSQWEWLNPMPSGYSNSKVVFVDHNTGYILNSNGDLYKTTNRGEEWKQGSSFSNNLCMDIKDSTGIVAGYFGTIYLSTDNGNRWTQLFAGISDHLSTVNIVSRDTIFLSGSSLNGNNNGNIYKTTDRGKTWTTLRCGTAISSVAFVNSKIGFVGGSQSIILKTEDGGVTWSQKRRLNSFPTGILSIQFLNKDTGFAFQEHSTLLRTNDGGNTWIESNANHAMQAMDFVNASDGYIGGDNGALYATHDGGKTFSWIGFDNGLIDGNEINSIDFLTKDIGFAVGALGRIMKTTNAGASWTAYSPTYKPIAAVSFVSGSVAYAAIGAELYKTTDKWKTWTLQDVGSRNGFGKMHFLGADTGFITTSYPALLNRTFNAGKTWDTINVTPYGFDRIEALQFLNSKVGFMSLVQTSAGKSGSIVKTKDGGATWDTIWNAKYMGEGFEHIFYIDEDTGFAINYNRLYKTTDGSKTWQPVYISSDTRTLTSLTFTTKDKGFVTDDYSNIYSTNDGGKTWVTKPLPVYYSSGVNTLKFFNPQVGYLTAGNSFGPSSGGAIYKTVDSGTTWIFEKNVGGRSISFTPDTAVVISGFGGSILTSRITGFRVLPVQLFKLAAAYSPKSTLLTWHTASEINSNYFVIEKSPDGINFKEAGTTPAKRNSSIVTSYQFSDTGTTLISSKTIYYRVKTVDIDGSYSYSNTVAVNIPKSSAGFVVSPNPASTTTTIYFNQSLKKATVSVFDQQGRKVFADQLTGETSRYRLATAKFSAGLYTIVIEDSERRSTSQVVILK